MNIAIDSNLERLGLKIILDDPSYITWFKEEYFTSPWIVVFRALKDCDSKIDKNILISKLTQTEQLAVIGGEAVISQIFDVEYDPELVDSYIQSLKELYIKRQAQISLYSLVERAPRIEVGDLYTAIEAIKSTIVANVGVGGEDEETFSSVLDSTISAIFNKVDDSNLIKTGFPTYDILMGGGEKSNLEIIAARPSVGKSSLLLQLLITSAKNGVPAEMISYEMSNQQIALRALSCETGIPSQRLKQGAMSEEEKVKLQQAAKMLRSIPFNISYTASASIDELCNHIKIAHEHSGIEVFGIDYVQQIPVQAENEANGLYKIARKLKSLAKDLNILIYLVSQLNRSVDSRKSKIPILTDLRQSGGLEESADKVIFIHRKYTYTLDEKDRGIADVIVAKNRNGPIATFNLMFDDSITKFYELG